MSIDLSTDASGSNNITIATRRNEWISQKPSHPEYNTDIICPDSGHEADVEQPAPRQTCKRGGRGRRGGGGEIRGSERRGLPVPAPTAISNSKAWNTLRHQLATRILN